MSSSIPLELVPGTEAMERLIKAQEAFSDLEQLSSLLGEGESFWSFPGQSEEEHRVERAFEALSEFFAHQVLLAYYTGQARVIIDLLSLLPEVSDRVYKWVSEEIVYNPDDADEQLTKMMRGIAQEIPHRKQIKQ